jgi:hypothetical protein
MAKRFLRPTLPTLMACVCLTIPRLAAAQIAAGVTAGLSSQQGSGRGGTTIGGVTFLDASLGDRFSLGGEASLGAGIKGEERRSTSAGIADLSSRHHDTIFSGVVKANVARAFRAQIDGTLGLGASWRHTVRKGTFRSLVIPGSSAPVEETLSNAVFATTVGFDAMLNFSPRTSMLFTARLHLLNDDDRDASGAVQRGVGSSIFRVGGGALIRF